MKKINEQKVDYEGTLYLNIGKMIKEYPGYDWNKLRDMLEENGAITDGIRKDTDDDILLYMVINGMSENKVLQLMSDYGVDELEDGEFLTYSLPNEVSECGDSMTECGDTINENENSYDSYDAYEAYEVFKKSDNYEKIYYACEDEIQTYVDENQIDSDEFDEVIYPVMKNVLRIFKKDFNGVTNPNKLTSTQFSNLKFMMQDIWYNHDECYKACYNALQDYINDNMISVDDNFDEIVYPVLETAICNIEGYFGENDLTLDDISEDEYDMLTRILREAWQHVEF